MTVLATAVVIALVALAAAGLVASSKPSIGSNVPHETTTIFISVDCTSSIAVTNGNSTTTYVSTFVGNLTAVTTVKGFSTNATAVCR